MVDDSKPERGAHSLPVTAEPITTKTLWPGLKTWQGRELEASFPDPTRWTSEREMIETLDRLEVSWQRAGKRKAGFIGAILGFLLGYFTWGIWPSWPLIVKMFNQCYLGG